MFLLSASLSLFFNGCNSEGFRAVDHDDGCKVDYVEGTKAELWKGLKRIEAVSKPLFSPVRPF